MEAKRRSSRTDAVRFVARVRKAIDRGADTAESIHRKAAELPLAPFEGMDVLEGALADVRRMQDRSIGAVYDLVRSVNREVARLAEDWLAPRRRTAKGGGARRPAAKKRVRVVAHAAA